LEIAEKLNKSDASIPSMKSLCYAALDDFENSRHEAEKAIRIDQDY
jgi:hypothetical protein